LSGSILWAQADVKLSAKASKIGCVRLLRIGGDPLLLLFDLDDLCVVLGLGFGLCAGVVCQIGLPCFAARMDLRFELGVLCLLHAEGCEHGDQCKAESAPSDELPRHLPEREEPRHLMRSRMVVFG
jgi:hypothetical protein